MSYIDFEDAVIALIENKRTYIDEAVLENEKFTYPKHVKYSTMTEKKEFTDEFLKLIDSQFSKPYPVQETDAERRKKNAMFEMITFKMINHSGLYRNYIPANRLYFLFLANIYCNSLFYFEKYPWLPQLLSIFEQTGLTGEFILDRRDYRELFSKCHDEKKIKAELDFAMVYDPLDNKHKPDTNLKNLSNTTLERASKSHVPANGLFRLRPCIHGMACYQRNPAHLSSFSHPSVVNPSVVDPILEEESNMDEDPSEAGPSEAGPSEAGPSEAGPSEAGPSVSQSGKMRHRHSHATVNHNKKPYSRTNHGGKRRVKTRRKHKRTRSRKSKKKTIKRK